MRNKLYILALTAVMLGVSGIAAHVNAKECKTLGGMGLADAIDDTNLVASLTGGLSGGARARITAQRETATGLSLDMAHHFFTDEGGLLKTNDIATLTTVPGKNQTYMLEIAYSVVGSTGAFDGYGGGFQSFGLIDLGAGKLVLRYKGEICKK